MSVLNKIKSKVTSHGNFVVSSCTCAFAVVGHKAWNQLLVHIRAWEDSWLVQDGTISTPLIKSNLSRHAAPLYHVTAH